MEGRPFAVKGITPILRMFDEQKAREFYLDFLGFHVDWEHRYGENFPLYMQVSHGDCVLHLSEHYGDACPGSSIRVETTNIEAFHAELLAKDYKYYKPGLETTPWHTKEVVLRDPFGNKLIFYENV